MGRGRNRSASDVRVLLEILLHRDRAVFGAEIAENLPVSKERVRQILGQLADDGYVEINQVSGRNLYRLTDSGFEHLAEKLRETVD
ncbi:MAG: helix-turn-helix domain-containing protein [Halovenus sp.]